VNPANLYSEAAVGRLSPAIAGALVRVYVPCVDGAPLARVFFTFAAGRCSHVFDLLARFS